MGTCKLKRFTWILQQFSIDRGFLVFSGSIKRKKIGQEWVENSLCDYVTLLLKNFLGVAFTKRKTQKNLIPFDIMTCTFTFFSTTKRYKEGRLKLTPVPDFFYLGIGIKLTDQQPYGAEHFHLELHCVKLKVTIFFPVSKFLDVNSEICELGQITQLYDFFKLLH